jgi:hypothetical protein
MNVTIDFDTYPDGSTVPGGVYVSNEWFDEYGVSLSASGGYLDIPRLLNTSSTDVENDLGSPNEKCSPPGPGVGAGGEPNRPGANCVPQGNVLIVQESNTERPDDNRGGVITFDFAPNAVAVYAIGFMDIDRHPNTTVEVVHQPGGLPKTTLIPVPLFGCNSVQTVEVNIKNVSKMKVNMSGSGAITFISCCFPPGGGIKPPVSTTPVPIQVPSKRPSPSKAPTNMPSVSPALSVSHSPSASPAPSHVPIVSPAPTTSASPTSVCVNATIDFETLPNGTSLSGGSWVANEWLDEYGLSLSASGGLQNSPRLLNTSDVENWDYAMLRIDQGSPNQSCDPPGPGVGEGGEPSMQGENCLPQGNVLIIMDDPNDEYPYDGVIKFEFMRSMEFVHAVGLLDVEGNATTIHVVHDSGMGIETTTINVTGMGANSVQTVPINQNNVSQLRVNLAGMEAVTFISFCYFGTEEPHTETPGAPVLTPVPRMLRTRTPSVSARQLARNRSSTPYRSAVDEQNGVMEKILDQECNMGFYDASNLKVIDSDDLTVSFNLKHSFCTPALSHILVWFENTNQSQSPDYCWDGLNLECGETFGPFEAMCSHGWAIIDIAGGASEGADEAFQHFVDVDEPFCQSNRYPLPKFNPNKHCYWRLDIPCSCGHRNLDDAQARARC